MLKIVDLSLQLASGKITSRALVERCLGNIEDSNGEGARAFLTVYKDRALDAADLADGARARGLPVSPFSGIPVSIKDLFDVAGDVTKAGSHVLNSEAPAVSDATIVTALRRAGFIIIGKTNMTEFAFSGLGINEHYGTPLNPFDRNVGRVPGGSSSGGAVSVSDVMSVATIGTDTGGSCRIPAAFCGIVGFKPTSQRVPRTGAVPLSASLDSIGPLGNSVSCCAILDSVLSGGTGVEEDAYPPEYLHVGVIGGYLTEQIDEQVASAYESALKRLANSGVRLTEITIDEFSGLPSINSKGGLVGAEAYAWHRQLLASRSHLYDPWVRARLEFASVQTAADYVDLLNHRERLVAVVRQKTHVFDALVMPTVQIIPPTVEAMQDSLESSAVNQLCLRNTAIGNFLNRPSISLPCHVPGSAPAGLMLMGETNMDRQLLSIALGIEHIVRIPQ